MSTTIDEDHRAAHNLDEELEQLRAQEAALEQRTGRLEISNPLALVLSLAGLAIAIGALVAALGARTDVNGSTVMSRSVNGSAGGRASGMMGSTASGGVTMGGVHGRFAAGQVAAAAKGTVYVDLGDYWVRPAASSVRAGRITFVAKNVGRIPHELMVERAPIKMTSMGKPDEDAAQAMIDDTASGRSGHTTVRLKPGRYVLFCNAPGHYAAGQHIPFTVTS